LPPGLPPPRVFAGGVQGGPGQVEAGAGHLGLEPGEHPQGLRVAFESAARLGDHVQRRFAVVAERRVAEIVGEAGHVDDVGVAAEAGPHLAGDLRDLEGVGQSRTQKVVRPGGVHLGLGRQAAEAGGMEYAGPVALVRRTSVAAVLGRFGDPPLAVGRRHAFTLSGAFLMPM